MSESYKKLIKTLQTIFEMDKADLDFGIYRIMNQKRDDINKFLEDDLLPQVKQAFDDYSSEGQGDLQQELSTAIEQAKSFGAPDPENAPAVLKIKAKMANAVDATALENDVFSKLHTFFSRYYDQGDFISQRRYKADTYAIPYQGEEVKLYWANHDQYYIKSSEHLRDYAFLANDDKKSVRIKLMEADTEKDNVKAKAGEERRFVLDEESPLSEEDGELLIHFNFIPVGKQKQEKLNDAAVKTILAQEGFEEWLTILKVPAPTEAKPKRTLLERHLNEYTARNTFDYFIHKDLGGFLNRELDFFIKNEVLFLDDIDDAAFSVTEQQLRKIKIIRSIAKKVIRMLAQLENFQKKLWLKKKFVVDTDYCVAMSEFSGCSGLLDEVFDNSEQLYEWLNLYKVDKAELVALYEKKGFSGIIDDPKFSNLIIDTKYFSEKFKNELILSIDDIETKTAGLLINGDNFQGQKLIEDRYQNSIKAIYVDPPYNTSASEILYKNSYKHSSWLSLMNDRLLQSKSLLDSEEGMICCTIDDVEQKVLSQLLEQVYGEIAGTVAIRIKPSGRPIPNGFALSHEYAIFSRLNENNPIKRLSHSDEQIARYRDKDEKGRYFWEMFRKAGSNSNRENRPTMYYPFFVNTENSKVRLANVKYDEAKEAYELLEKPLSSEVIVHPIKDDNSEGRWYFGYDRAKRVQEEFKAVQQEDKTYRIYYRRRPNEGVQPTTNWFDSKYSATEHGTALLKNMFGTQEIFSYPKSIHAVYDCLSVCGVASDKNSVVLDFFAGSGTTAHAVLKMNCEDSGSRKYILVEMAEYFRSVLLPRVKKASYAVAWSDGFPQAVNEGLSGRIIKYITIETYEDVLNNLNLVSNETNKDLLKNNQSFNEDYMLGYWLDTETTNSSSLLNIEQFEDPFNYKLNIGSGSVGATKPTTVDLVETFNYLIGLTVKTIDALKGFRLITGTNPQGETVLVVWRNIKENDNDALEAFLDKQGYNPRDTEFDHIYVNGDHTLEDPQSKVKMTEIEFKRLMFDVSDV